MKKDFKTPLFPIPLHNGDEIYVKCVGTYSPSVAPVLYGENMHDGENEQREYEYHSPVGELLTEHDLASLGVDMEALEFITMERINDVI